MANVTYVTLRQNTLQWNSSAVQWPHTETYSASTG